MAITSAWTHEIPASQLPTGATTPTVADPAAPFNVSEDLTYDAAGTLDNATPATAFAAIGDAVKTYFDASVDTAVLGLDAAATINVRLVITHIIRLHSTFSYGDYQEQYQVGNDVFRVTYRAEWAVAA